MAKTISKEALVVVDEIHKRLSQVRGICWVTAEGIKNVDAQNALWAAQCLTEEVGNLVKQLWELVPRAAEGAAKPAGLQLVPPAEKGGGAGGDISTTDA